MIVPCEIAVKSVIPAVKALIAKELVEKRGLKQDEAAEILGVSQSAVSKYTRKVRGYVIKVDDIEEIKPLIDEMIGILVSGTYRRGAFLRCFLPNMRAHTENKSDVPILPESRPKNQDRRVWFLLKIQFASKMSWISMTVKTY